MTIGCIQSGATSRLVALLAAFCVVLGAWSARHAAGQAQPEVDQRARYELPGQEGLTVIEADSIQFESSTARYVAKGRVEVTSPRGHLLADAATLQTTPKQEIDWVKVTGNVRLRQKRENGVIMSATGAEGEYRELAQTANLTGGVTLRYEGANLNQPAVMTGARADMNLKAETSVVTRAQSAPVKVVVTPKPKPPAAGQPAPATPEPVELYADRIESDAKANTYIATGSPYMIRGTSRMSAEKLSMVIDPQTNDLKQANAEKNVTFDGMDADGAKLHATGDHAVYEAATTTLTVTGRITGTKTPKEGAPHKLFGRRFVYNTQSREWSLSVR